MLSKRHISIIAMVLLVLYLLPVNANAATNPMATSGYLDLSDYNFEENGKLSLKGEWEFYWNQLLAPEDIRPSSQSTSYVAMPMLWNHININEEVKHFGCATYRLKVALPEQIELLAFHMENIYSSYKVWINGKLLVEKGKVGLDKASTKHNGLPSTRSFYVNSKEPVEIVIQVANFYHRFGGIKNAPLLGLVDPIEKSESLRIISHIFLSGSLVFIGLAFLFLSTFWKNDNAILYFALFCLSWSYNGVVEFYAPLMDVFSFVDWEVNSKFKYITLYLAVLFGILFFFEIFRDSRYYKFVAVFKWLIIGLILFTIILPSTLFTYLLNLFFILSGVVLIAIGYEIINAIRRKSKYSVYASLSIISGAIVFTSHMILYLFHISNGILLLNVAYLFFFLLTSMMLGVRFTNNFIQLEKLQMQTSEQKEELSAQADLLKHVNEEIVNQKQLLEERNEQIRTINGDLEKKIDDRTAKLISTNKELDLFLYRASHDLRRPISTILGIDQLAKLSVKEKDALELFERVQSTVQGMDQMLKKFISISEIYNHEVNLKTIEREYLIKNVKAQANYFADMHQVPSFQLNVDGPETIYTDPFILNKITSYLLENSFMFSSKMKDNTLKIQVKLFNNGTKLKMKLDDNGIGIKQEVLDKIFNMYFIGNTKSTGNGLGLHIVKKAVEKLEGSIEVISKKNEGSTFNMSLNDLL